MSLTLYTGFPVYSSLSKGSTELKYSINLLTVSYAACSILIERLDSCICLNFLHAALNSGLLNSSSVRFASFRDS
nr:MAG TPA: hypothetical protein [Bacteriophage sp.]